MFSELPFDLEVQVACSEPSYSQSLLNGGRFKLCCGHGESSVCSVLAANEQVSGLQFRIYPDSGWSPGPDPKWSPPYPIASSWSKPPFLVEVRISDLFLIYNFLLLILLLFMLGGFDRLLLEKAFPISVCGTVPSWLKFQEPRQLGVRYNASPVRTMWIYRCMYLPCSILSPPRSPSHHFLP